MNSIHFIYCDTAGSEGGGDSSIWLVSQTLVVCVQSPTALFSWK